MDRTEMREILEMYTRMPIYNRPEYINSKAQKLIHKMLKAVEYLHQERMDKTASVELDIFDLALISMGLDSMFNED